MFLARRCGLRASLRCNRVDSRTLVNQPNPPLNLDPSLQALLQDVDISLAQGKGRMGKHMKELEVLAMEEQFEVTNALSTEEEDSEYSMERKSPAAHYGSQQIGAVILPNQLQNTISVMISESDKVQLHSDAKRLFFDEEGDKGAGNEWDASYSSHTYRSRKQASRHGERDGTAFASVALPAHYSAISSVFDHLKRRLEPTWKVERIIDWGAGTGSGLWAALHAFQNRSLPENETRVQDSQIANSTIATYLGIDKRDGLVAIGKRLFRDLELGNLSISWQKSFKEEDQIRRTEGLDTVALSAFMLTSLPTPLARKTMVKEMWESGANLIVLIDHNTTAGFEAIAEAREYLLNVGRKESHDPEAVEWPIRGSHVVAPCPHDHVCPLHHPGSTRLVCGFAQRIQRPSFVRKTKHSGVGHEDIEYSYVVIRRGPRPSTAITNFGRVGEVGRRALDKEAQLQVPVKELKLHSEHEDALGTAVEETLAAETPINELEGDPKSHAELQEALRQEAFSWPRLVFPPLKKSGHVILDSCTAEGKIMRLTIPRSQGKQEYYDARKSSWGDLFPHPPKNPPQERYQPLRAKREGGTTATKGSDIGKRGDSDKKKDRPSYETLSKGLREKRKKSRRDRVRDLELERN
ncbi:Rsm22-cox11 tandem protein 2, mitochondrial [Hypsizygus marmoreus]|uniref:Rsm22-cox11 tandem protein 2, mitochondrial n=1 Tax=Hypsizygus marmoreus TaxID=39966 RepID=A0A369K785_HYPMA|nr:Rsm22-cox11 tandem protein 2, mitochondrial [Hypsizygus marmoreus]